MDRADGLARCLSNIIYIIYMPAIGRLSFTVVDIIKVNLL